MVTECYAEHTQSQVILTILKVLVIGSILLIGKLSLGEGECLCSSYTTHQWPPCIEFPSFQGFLPRGYFFGSELKLRSLFSGECRSQVIPQDPPLQCIMSVDVVKGTQLGGVERWQGSRDFFSVIM